MVLAGHDHVYSRGFVDAQGNNATDINKDLTQNQNQPTFNHVDNAPFHMVAEHAGGLKWYQPKAYTVTDGDPIALNYEFLDKNSSTEDSASYMKKEQTYVIVEMRPEEAHFTAYKFKYDAATDAITTEPYVYDQFTILKGQSQTGEPGWDIEEGQILSGDKKVTVTLGRETDDAFILVDEEKHINPSGSGQVTFNYESHGIQATDGNDFKNGLLVNGVYIEDLNEHKPSIDLSDAALKMGEENTLTLVIGNKNGYYDETLKPGAVNHDDFEVWNFTLTLPNGDKVKPHTVRTYQVLNKDTAAADESRINEAAYSENSKYELGDGPPGTPNFDKLYKIDLVFNLPEANSLVRTFDLATTDYADGPHTLKLVVNEETIEEAKVIFDNSAPVVSANLPEGPVADQTELEVTAKDEYSKVTDLKVSLNGVAINLPYVLDSEVLGTGTQFLTVWAKDEQGNETTASFQFVMENPDQTGLPADGKQVGDVYQFNAYTNEKMEGPVDVAFYRARPLNYQVASSISTGSFSLNEDAIGQVDENGYYSETTAEGLPYQLYTVDTTYCEGPLNVSLTAKVKKGEIAVLKIFNPDTNTWDEVDSAKSAGSDLKLGAEVDCKTFSKNNKVKFIVTQKLADNGSNTFAWFTDTQYYTQREELINDKIYEQMTTWLRDQYLAGKIGYVAHTGDLIETKDNEAQFKIAAAAHDILDQAGVPNGVTTGNHDVGDFGPVMTYNNYNVYFGKDCYQDQFWFGGEYGNNTHHYDLVTVGGHDLIILYLGMGLEATPETVAWANEVLAMYPHRTAIIATHQYLSPSANWITYSRAEEIYDKIIVPKPNVAMVICGHDPGAARNVRAMKDGRQLVEILHDYQHEEKGGNGFLRLMKFTETGLITTTYSPVTNSYNVFSEEKDAFSMDVDFVQNERQVASKDFVALIKGKENTETNGTPFSQVTVEAGETAQVKLPVDAIDFTEWFAVATGANGHVYTSEVLPIVLGDVEEPTEPTPTPEPTPEPNPGEDLEALVWESLSGAWSKGMGDWVIKANASLEDLLEVRFDDKVLYAKENGDAMETDAYKLESGSTILTIKAAFLEKQAQGAHRVSMTFATGETVEGGILSQSFEVKAGTVNTDPTEPTKPTRA
jgi:hypothetical protein